MYSGGHTRKAVAGSCALLSIWVLSAGAVHADVPMFAFVAMTRIWYWWAIPGAILIEAAVFHFALGLSWKKALWISLAVNAVSGLLGIPLYPIVGMMLYPFVAPVITGVFGYGFGVEAVATLSALIALDTGIEFLVLASAHRVLRVALSRQTALWLGVANLLSTLLLVGLIATVPNLPSLDPDPDAPARLTPDALAPVTQHYAEEIAFMGQIGGALWQGEKVARPELDPAQLAIWQAEARGMKFRNLGIVIQSRPERETVETTFLLGSEEDRNPVLWVFHDADTGYGCAEFGPCFARDTDASGRDIYHTRLNYSASGYLLTIIATVGGAT